MKLRPQPCVNNAYYKEYIGWILQSYHQYFGKDLIPFQGSEAEIAQAVYEAEFPILAHNIESDPKINYANQQTQSLFEADWETLIGISSRKTAPAQALAQRSQALAEAMQKGYVQDYQGQRITVKGRRFTINQANLWTVSNLQEQVVGQAAAIFRVTRHAYDECQCDTA